MNSSASRFRAVLLSFALVPAGSLLAAVELASPFGDHMVLQQGRPVPVWGTAAVGENVIVTFAAQKKSVTAGADGKWRLDLSALPVSAQPQALTVTGSATPAPLVFNDVLVGEVWLCGGQSNMERQLGPRPPQPAIYNWQSEVARADYPLIRQLYVKQTRADAPQSSVAATWSVCSPATVAEFTAVGYFFARDLHAARGVPVGIIHSSWGGTLAEAWTSAEGLSAFPAFTEALAHLRESAINPESARRQAAERMERWYRRTDPGSGENPWSAPALDVAAWETVKLPVAWEDAGRASYDGVVWFRKTFDLPAGWAGHDVELRLGAIDDIDTTWCNGALVGTTTGWTTPRVYRVPAASLKPTGNVIAVRVLDTAGNGGFWNKNLPLEVAAVGSDAAPVSLAGEWRANFSVQFAGDNRPPAGAVQSTAVPTVLYNGMIAPLVPYAIRGVAFYQGESNASRAKQYRTLFPALIADWRRLWAQDDLPFLFVQIAPFRDQPPEIREAQFLAWQKTPHTALAVTIDVGDANDIHPANKEPVGVRLALAARAVAYGEQLVYSGPAFAKLEVAGARAVVHFTHVGGGLVAPGGRLEGFTVAGADGVFHTANAEIAGDTVIVTADAVPQPVSVRYAWANVARGNLFNRAGLPASPFRTHVD